MAGWMLKSAGDALLAAAAADSLRARFLVGYGHGDWPQDCAIFQRHESEGRLHCELLLYFAPGCAALAREAGARPCAAPAPAGLDLLIGNPLACPPGPGGQTTA
jgi:hypothetical protein